MNFFSSDPFLDALAAARFSGRRCEPVRVAVDGGVYRVLSVDGRPVVSVPFLDLLEPAADGGSDDARPLGWLPVALRGTVTLDGWRTDGPPPECEPCPTLLWSAYGSWDAAAAALPRQADTRRKQRRLEAEIGTLRYVEEDADPAGLRRCLAWKSHQYRATGHVDRFADPRNVRLFERLRDGGAIVLSSLYAGDRLAAVHVGVRHHGRFMSWIPAYDPELRKYSPGRILQHAMMEDSYRRGDREFDFLIGDEAYKYEYATHVRIAGPVGTPPLPLRARTAMKAAARAALNRAGLLERARSLRRRLAGPR